MPDICNTVLGPHHAGAGGADGKTYPPQQSNLLLDYFAPVKAGRMFVQPTVKQLLGRLGHRLGGYLRANAATLNTQRTRL